MDKRIFLLLVLIFYSAVGQAKINLTDSTRSIQIGKHLYVLTPKGEIGFRQAHESNSFVRSSEIAPNLGLHATSVWIKFTVSNQSDKDHFLLKIDHAILNQVDLYIPTGNNRYLLKRSGEAIPFSKREFKPPFILFDLELPSGTQKTYYIRVKSSEQLILPLSITSPKGLWHGSFIENLIIGFFVGVILIMAVYNLFLSVSTKDRSYIYYVAYIVFAGLTQTGISGFNYLFFWPESPQLEMMSIQLFACLGGTFALLFTHHFLRIRQYAPFLNKLFIGLIAIFGVAVLLTLFKSSKLGFWVMQLNTTVTSLSIIGISFYIMIRQKDYVPAKIFFAAWAILVTTSIIFLLKDSNLLPYNNFTRYSFKIGTVIEASLLSFALAYRINILKKETELSHLEALRLANENKQIIKEQNVLLEQRVRERTQELYNQTHILNKTNENLKQTQTQLVAAEKMSSLGQLTAGIAHEINNPINFVAANISPLKRDIHQLFDTIGEIERIGTQNKTAEEKKQEIAEYKAETELEYVQTEIQQLLNGIAEGASRTSEIVKGLRIFSRLDEDDWKNANINEGLNATLTICSNLLKGIEIVTDFKQIPLVTCYPGKLNQVFLNIITNAIFAIRKKHGDNIGGQLTITTSHETDFVLVTIEDDGIGMDETTRSKLFDPFFTTKPVGEGTGLGMAIVFTIVRQHKAQLSVSSQVGQGSKFVLKLPVDPLVLPPNDPSTTEDHNDIPPEEDSDMQSDI